MKTAMILAAGRGERLRPFTDKQPKALCTIHNIPLIEYHVANLARAGFKRLIINHAYLGGQIRERLGQGARWNVEICYSPEPPGGLETGGGILNAMPLLGDEPFLTVNADIFTDYNFAEMSLPCNSKAHLILVTKPYHLDKGDFGLSGSNELVNNNREYTFAGIACYHPSLFNNLRLGRYSIIPLVRELADKKQASGEFFEGQWIDIGTPERLKQANSAVKLD